MSAVASSVPAPAPTGRFLRMSDVVADVRLSERTINRLHRSGQFPKKRKLSPRIIGWFESDIEAWKAARATVC